MPPRSLSAALLHAHSLCGAAVRCYCFVNSALSRGGCYERRAELTAAPLVPRGSLSKRAPFCYRLYVWKEVRVLVAISVRSLCVRAARGLSCRPDVYGDHCFEPIERIADYFARRSPAWLVRLFRLS